MYTTKENVVSLIGKSDPNIILDDWMDWADAEVESRTGKLYKEIEVSDEKYDGSGNDELLLNEYPIIEVIKVEYLYQYQPAEIWTELDSKYYRLYEDEGVLKLTPDLSGLSDINEFEEGVQNWRIGYKYGTVDVPKIVELLATLLVAELYYKSVTGGESSGTVKSEKIGDYAISYDVTGEEKVTNIPKLIAEIVEKIKQSDTYYEVI